MITLLSQVCVVSVDCYLLSDGVVIVLKITVVCVDHGLLSGDVVGVL